MEVLKDSTELQLGDIVQVDTADPDIKVHYKVVEITEDEVKAMRQDPPVILAYLDNSPESFLVVDVQEG